MNVYHFKKGTEICNYSYVTKILSIRLNRQVRGVIPLWLFAAFAFAAGSSLGRFAGRLGVGLEGWVPVFSSQPSMRALWQELQGCGITCHHWFLQENEAKALFWWQLHKGFLSSASLPVQCQKNTFSCSSLPWIPHPDFSPTSAILAAY